MVLSVISCLASGWRRCIVNDSLTQNKKKCQSEEVTTCSCCSKSKVSGLQSRSNNSKCIYLHSCVKDVQVMGGFVNSPKTCTLQ